MDRSARALIDISLHDSALVTPVLHLENPTRQSAADVIAIMAHELGLRGRDCFLPYDEWLLRARTTGVIHSLAEFFEKDFRTLALGEIVLDTSGARKVSSTLRGSGGVDRDVVLKYVKEWKTAGYLV